MQGSGKLRDYRRRQLWTGVQPGTRRFSAAVSGRKIRSCEILRENSSFQPDQQRNHAENPADYDDFKLGDKLVIENAQEQVKSGVIEIKNETSGKTYRAATNFSDLEIALILKGGKINYMKG